VTSAELASVLSRRLSVDYQVQPGEGGAVRVSRSALSAAVIRISDVPGATVFRVRGGLPVYGLGTARAVADALRSSPEFRSV
jgi:hypothetical protein